MITIDVTLQSRMQQYLRRYKAWATAQQKSAPVIDHHVQGLPCFEAGQIDLINACQSPVIVIDNLKEGIHQESLFQRYRKDRRYLIFSGSQWQPQDHNWGFEYSVVWHNYYWFMFLENLANPYSSWFYQCKTYDWQCHKPWQFYSLTVTPRPHRIALISQLQQRLTATNWIYRNHYIDYGLTVSDLDIIDLTQGTIQQQFDQKFKHYDNSHLATTCVVDMTVANRCWYHLITESDYEGKQQFTPTEKTYRTLWTGQPFVVLGTQNFLQGIRNLGFQTYQSLWDESYDSATDRLAAVTDLCAALEQFDWRSAEPRLRSIAAHNRAVFLSLDTHAHREFLQMEQTVIDFCQKYL